MRSIFTVLLFVTFANVLTIGEEVNDLFELDYYFNPRTTPIRTNAEHSNVGTIYLFPKDPTVEVRIDEIEITISPRIAEYWQTFGITVMDSSFNEIEFFVENRGKQNVFRMSTNTHLDGNGIVAIWVGIRPKAGITSLHALNGENQVTLTAVSGYNVRDDTDFTFRPRFNAWTLFVFRNSYFEIHPIQEGEYEHGMTGNRPLLGLYVWNTVGVSQLKKLSFLVETSGVQLRNFTLRDRVGNVLNRQPAQIETNGKVSIYIGSRTDKKSLLVTGYTEIYLFADSEGWGDVGDSAVIRAIGEDNYYVRPAVGSLSQVLRKEPAIVWGSVFWDAKARKERTIADIAMNEYGIFVAGRKMEYSIPPKPFFVEDKDEDGER